MQRKNIPVVSGFPVYRLVHIINNERVIKGFFLFRRLAYFMIPENVKEQNYVSNNVNYYEITLFNIPRKEESFITKLNDIEYMERQCTKSRKVGKWYYSIL